MKKKIIEISMTWGLVSLAAFSLFVPINPWLGLLFMSSAYWLGVSSK